MGNKLNDIRYNLYRIKNYTEVYLYRLLLFFGYNQSIKHIPNNTNYCYVMDKARNEKEGGHYIKTCKYYRGAKGLEAGCTFIGFMGRDLLLGDMCKICNIKNNKLD